MPRLAAVLLDVLLAPLVACATAWVAWREKQVLVHGAPLNAAQRALAQALGLVHVERVRVVSAEVIPIPLPRWARDFAQREGWISRHIAGMTLGHGIVIRADYVGDVRLLAHELAHVGQYERLGGIARFLRQYLRECAWPGYPHGALEREARAAEACVSAHAVDVIPYRPAAAGWVAPQRIS